MISLLVGYGLRGAELSALAIKNMQIRQRHWAIVDLVGKGGHVRTLPVPTWVKQAGRSIERTSESDRRPNLPRREPTRDAIGIRNCENVI